MSCLLELYGTEEPLPAVRRFAVGALSFALVGGEVREVRFGGAEAIRAIQYLVRDRDWGTLAPTISDMVVDERDGLHITYGARCDTAEESRLDYRLTIRATPTSLEVEVEAHARGDVETNRLGFCVLHPAELAGAPLMVEHGDGSRDEACFPELIERWQPFTDIAALTHQQDGVTVTCRLEGDSFEMEDQRNWSDASYKTYVRPLAKPWPYVVPDGTRDRQAVRLQFTGKPPLSDTRPDVIDIRLGEIIGEMPRIGLAIAPEEAEATAAAVADVVAIGVQDLLLSVDTSRGEGLAELQALARAAEIPARRTLEAVIAANGDLDAELGDLADAVHAAKLPIDALVVVPKPDLQSTPPGSAWPPCPPLAEVYAAARRAFPGVPLGGGMYSYFTELNRKRVPADQLAFVTHATCPIVHAADDRSVMQSLEAMPAILRSARAIYPDLAYRLGPITIGMRQNPYGSRTMPNPKRRRMPMAMLDPRQDGRFAAAWTLGYAARTETVQLDTLTLGAVTGPLGVIGPAGLRPVAETVRLLAALAGQPRRRCATSDNRIAAVAGGGRLLLANLTDALLAVRSGDALIDLDAYEVVETRAPSP
jgi:hypothetical protein